MKRALSPLVTSDHLQCCVSCAMILPTAQNISKRSPRGPNPSALILKGSVSSTMAVDVPMLVASSSIHASSVVSSHMGAKPARKENPAHQQRTIEG